MEQDVRWKQRFQNYCKAFAVFESAVETAKSRALSELEKQGLIQSFEFTQELSWKTLKDFLEYKGADSEIVGSKDAVRKAFAAGIIENGDVWMDMIASRNVSINSYEDKVANKILEKSVSFYYEAFKSLKLLFEKKL